MRQCTKLTFLNRFSAFLLALFFVLSITSCDLGSRRADLVILNGAEPESIDPPIFTGQAEGRVAYALFEGLSVLTVSVNHNQE